MKKAKNMHENLFFQKVYFWMFLGLLISAMVAFIVPIQFSFLLVFLYSSRWIYLGFFLAYLLFIWYFSKRILKLSHTTAIVLFIIQAILLGIFISSIFIIYELGSIALIFFVTSIIFLLLSLFGYFTKIDLTSLGPILSVGLIGIIIVSVINIFLGNGLIDTIISVIAVIIFIGFTMYDTQKLKEISRINESHEMMSKLAIIGALSLYLDYVNLFLNLLSLFGNRR
jgi:FtsH-binding integral membrane protein